MNVRVHYTGNMANPEWSGAIFAEEGRYYRIRKDDGAVVSMPRALLKTPLTEANYGHANALHLESERELVKASRRTLR